MNTCIIRWYSGILLLSLPAFLGAQNIQALTNRANRRLNEGKLEEAAILYEKAGRLQGGKSDQMLNAAECYQRLRNYEKSADCYRSVQSSFNPTSLTGLQYARALKQSGKYAEATEAFKEFARNYTGELKAQIIPVVQTEIKGCALAQEIKLPVDSAAAAQLPKVVLLPPAINSKSNEIAPIPFSDKILYFAVLGSKNATFMRSVKKDNVWQAAEKAGGLPDALSKHFGNGSFSPDGKRFFCSQCTDEKARKKGRQSTAPVVCALYVLHFSDAGWSTPERLPDYINLSGSTSMHPFVTQQNGKEILFFVSDRPGGIGGLDLYRSERLLSTEQMDFSLPQNLGPQVNTWGDELSPFFDTYSETLWFSSNGHVSLGGLDIFSCNWEDHVWTKPENAGVPLNSPADDLFYISKKNGRSAYFVSNRMLESQKTDTFEQDIFEYYPNSGKSR
ncbi:MAG: tetratricopeptide repeat protein [Bacteroidota bacterium]